MALLIKADGTTENVMPAEGGQFTLKELQNAVDGHIEIVYGPENSEYLFVVNEEGKLLDLPFNLQATLVACNAGYIRKGDYIVGNMLICLTNQID